MNLKAGCASPPPLPPAFFSPSLLSQPYERLLFFVVDFNFVFIFILDTRRCCAFFLIFFIGCYVFFFVLITIVPDFLFVLPCLVTTDA